MDTEDLKHMREEREKEIDKAADEFIGEDGSSLDQILIHTGFKQGVRWADMNPSVETMLKLFWFFDKHGLIRDDLCFDPQHFMETVAKEHFKDFEL